MKEMTSAFCAIALMPLLLAAVQLFAETVTVRPKATGEAQEIVDFLLYLASDRCPSVTGSTHLVDAGRLCVGRGSTAGFLEAGK